MGEDGSTPEVTNPQGKVGEKRSEAVGWLSKWGVCVSREEDLKKKAFPHSPSLFLCCSVENGREGGQRKIKRLLFRQC